MAGDLVPFAQGATALATSVMQFVNEYRQGRAQMRTERQTELRLVIQRAEMLLREEYARQSAKLARVNIEEIAETAKMIEDHGLTGSVRDAAMEQLAVLSRKLVDSLGDFNVHL
jgi:hypothetical protein